MKRVLPVLVLVLLFSNCVFKKADKDYAVVVTPPACDTANVSFANKVLPFLTSNCTQSGCHNSTDQANGMVLDTYDGAKAVALNKKSGISRLIGSINQWTTPTTFYAMPKGGSKLDSCSINKVTAWVNQGLLNN
jgi:hypothetical protein